MYACTVHIYYIKCIDSKYARLYSMYCMYCMYINNIICILYVCANNNNCNINLDCSEKLHKQPKHQQRHLSNCSPLPPLY